INATGLTGASHSVQLATRIDGINYYGFETLDVDLGSGDDVFNVQGTSATTNLNLHDGNDSVYVSDSANVTQSTRAATQFLPGKLDYVAGDLNIDGGKGTHLLMVSDEATSQADSAVEITNKLIKGLAPAEIHYTTDSAGTFAKGITIWTSNYSDTIAVNS